ncbi:MAG: LemA family protein [Ferruginibacter sp.]
MNKKRTPLFIALAALAAILLYFISTYNGLVKKEEKVKLQWNEVQNAYQRRLNLIPSLVNVVKGLANYEQTTLQQIAEARAKAASVTVSGNEISADTYNQQTTAQDNLAIATNNLIISIEKYPSLKGTSAFSDLQTQLEGTERRIKVARKDFNGAVAAYNNAVRRFPSSLVAGITGFKVKEGFQADAGADKSTEIKF